MNIDPSRIHKAFHTVTFNGRFRGPFITDLQWDEGQWYLVFEWENNHDGEYPARRVPIETHLLQGGAPQYTVEAPVIIDDPELGEWIFRMPSMG